MQYPPGTTRRDIAALWLRRARNASRTTLRALVSGAAICALMLLSGCALLIAGVRLNFGNGWALMVGSLPLLAAAFVLLRGLARA